MNPSSLSITLRPRSLAETADLALRFVVRHFEPYARLSVVCLVVPGVALWGLRLWLPLGASMTWFLVYVWILLVEGVFVQLGAELLFGNRVTMVRLLGSLLRRSLTYLATLVVTQAGFAVQAVTLVLLPRGYSRMVLMPEVVLLEGLRGRAALGRCARLGRLFGSRLVGLLGLSTLIVVMMAVLGDVLGQVALHLFMIPLPRSASLFEDGVSLSAILGVVATVPLLTTARLFVYVGERARQDGWDVQLRFQAILARQQEPS